MMSSKYFLHLLHKIGLCSSVPTVFPYFSPVWYINLQSSPTINIDINLFPRSLRQVHVPYHIFPFVSLLPKPPGGPLTYQCLQCQI